MVQYGTKEDHVKDQLNSYKKSITYLNQLKKRTKQEFLIDYRGDREKILLAIDAQFFVQPPIIFGILWV